MQMTDTATVLELRDTEVPTPEPQQLLVRLRVCAPVGVVGLSVGLLLLLGGVAPVEGLLRQMR